MGLRSHKKTPVRWIGLGLVLRSGRFSDSFALLVRRDADRRSLEFAVRHPWGADRMALRPVFGYGAETHEASKRFLRNVRGAGGRGSLRRLASICRIFREHCRPSCDASGFLRGPAWEGSDFQSNPGGVGLGQLVSPGEGFPVHFRFLSPDFPESALRCDVGAGLHHQDCLHMRLLVGLKNEFSRSETFWRRFGTVFFIHTLRTKSNPLGDVRAFRSIEECGTRPAWSNPSR